eukprot:COSAG04_NODE_9532_length_855_cov_0.679894_1_plen_263_part_10
MRSARRFGMWDGPCPAERRRGAEAYRVEYRMVASTHLAPWQQPPPAHPRGLAHLPAPPPQLPPPHVAPPPLPPHPRRHPRPLGGPGSVFAGPFPPPPPSSPPHSCRPPICPPTPAATTAGWGGRGRSARRISGRPPAAGDASTASGGAARGWPPRCPRRRGAEALEAKGRTCVWRVVLSRSGSRSGSRSSAPCRPRCCPSIGDASWIRTLGVSAVEDAEGAAAAAAASIADSGVVTSRSSLRPRKPSFQGPPAPLRLVLRVPV